MEEINATAITSAMRVRELEESDVFGEDMAFPGI
jgi:hypothetical protein